MSSQRQNATKFCESTAQETRPSKMPKRDKLRVMVMDNRFHANPNVYAFVLNEIAPAILRNRLQTNTKRVYTEVYFEDGVAGTDEMLHAEDEEHVNAVQDYFDSRLTDANLFESTLPIDIVISLSEDPYAGTKTEEAPVVIDAPESVFDSDIFKPHLLKPNLKKGDQVVVIKNMADGVRCTLRGHILSIKDDPNEDITIKEDKYGDIAFCKSGSVIKDVSFSY